MKIVRENINFERGSEDPFRSLDIGQYSKIRKEFERDKEIDLSKVIGYLEDLSHYIYEAKGKILKFSPNLNKTLSKYSKDSYHRDKIYFLRGLIIDVAHNHWTISEKEFLDWAIRYSKEIDPDVRTLTNTIYGVLYDLEMM